MLEKIIRRSLQVVIGLAFVTPLVVGLESFIFPFIVPKILFFRSLMHIGLGLFALYLIVYKATKPVYHTWIAWGVVAFFLSATLSTIFSTDSVRSFWDNHERMLGLFTMLHYVFFYCVARYVFQTREEWKWLFRWILVIGLPFVYVAFKQVFDPEFLLNQGSDRVRSTLGNTIYVSGYALFLATIACMLWAATRARWERIACVVVVVLQIAVVLATKTRGTMLGIGVALIVGALVAASWKTTRSRIRYILWAVVAAGIVSVGLLLAFRDTGFVKNNAFLNRMTHISLESGTGRTRTLAWRIAIESWKEHPVFGWGLNNFFYAFNKYYEPEFLRFGATETWFDNAHNIVLNTFTTQGVIGVLAYIFLFVVALIATWTIPRAYPDAYRAVWLVRLFLLAHFIHNIFVFENVTSYIVFFLLLAYLDSISHFQEQPASIPSKRRVQQPVMLGVSAFILIGVVWGIYQTNIKPGKANAAVLQAVRGMYVRDFTGALAWYEKAKAYNSPHQDDIIREFAQAVLRQVNAQTPELMQLHGARLYPLVLKDMRSQIERTPKELRFYLILAQLSVQQAVFTRTVQPLIDAEGYLRTALSLSPKRQQLLYELGQVYMLFGQREKGEAVFTEAIQLYPAIAESYWRFAVFYVGIQDEKKAAHYFKEALARGAESSITPDAVRLAISVFENQKDADAANAYRLLLPK